MKSMNAIGGAHVDDPNARLVVSSWPGREFDDNSMIKRFCDAVEAAGGALTPEPIDPTRGIPLNSELLLMHWPEKLFWGKKKRLHYYPVNFVDIARFRSRVNAFKKSGGKLVWVVNNLRPHDLNIFESWRWSVLQAVVCEHCDVMIALSEQTRDFVRGEIAKRAMVCPVYFVDHPGYPEFEFSAERALEYRFDLGADGEQIVCCVTGHLRAYKGLLDFLPIFVELSEQSHQKLSLHIAGKPASKNFERKLRTLADVPNMSFAPGRVSDEDMKGILSASDYFVFHSDEYLHSGSIMAALSAGAIIVAKDTPFVRSLRAILGEKFLISFDQFRERMCSSRPARLTVEERAKRSAFVLRRFSEERLAAQLRRILEQISGGRASLIGGEAGWRA